MENSRKRRTKEQYLLELLLGNTRLDIPGVWGISATALQRKLVRWGIATLPEEEQALMDYRNSLPTVCTTNHQESDPLVNDPEQKGDLSPKVTDDSFKYPTDQAERRDLMFFLRIPVVHVPVSQKMQWEALKTAIYELDVEANDYRGRGELVFKALEVMFAMTSLLYLDAHELSESEYFSKQQLRRLMIAANKQHLYDINERAELNHWKVISQ